MRVALTGGATGIGAAIAQKLNASGHDGPRSIENAALRFYDLQIRQHPDGGFGAQLWPGAFALASHIQSTCDLRGRLLNKDA